MKTPEVNFLAHFVGMKYLKSTGTWRLELDLFEKDVAIVPDHAKHVNKVVKVSYSEYQEGECQTEKLSNLLEDVEIQSLLGTNGVEETKTALEARTGLKFDDLDSTQINEIIQRIYKSIGGQQ